MSAVDSSLLVLPVLHPEQLVPTLQSLVHTRIFHQYSASLPSASHFFVFKTRVRQAGEYFLSFVRDLVQGKKGDNKGENQKLSLSVQIKKWKKGQKRVKKKGKR